MICPIFNGKCKEENCAWWYIDSLEEKPMCSMMGIAIKLDNLHDLIDPLTDMVAK